MVKVDTSDLDNHMHELLFMVEGNRVSGAYVESFDKDSIYMLTAEGTVKLKDTMSFYTSLPEAIEEAGPNHILKK